MMMMMVMIMMMIIMMIMIMIMMMMMRRRRRRRRGKRGGQLPGLELMLMIRLTKGRRARACGEVLKAINLELGGQHSFYGPYRLNHQVSSRPSVQ
ncbi:hypothetical protein DFP73DRAFT_635429, partial [Morchella snyderi]